MAEDEKRSRHEPIAESHEPGQRVNEPETAAVRAEQTRRRQGVHEGEQSHVRLDPAEGVLRCQHELLVQLSRTADLNESLSLFLSAAIHMSGMDCGCIFLADTEGDSLRLSTYQGFSEEFVSSLAHLGPQVSAFQSAQAGNPTYSNGSPLPMSEPGLREGLRAAALLPIMHEGKSIGCLYLASRTCEDFAEGMRPFAESTVSLVGGFINRSILDTKLRESERHYRTFINHSTEGIYRVDIVPPVSIGMPEAELIETINRRAFVAEVNRSLAQMYGLSPGEMIGRPATDFAPDYGARAVLVLKNEEFQAANVETRDIDKDGRDIFLIENYHGVIVDGRLVSIWGTQSEITERKKAEEALRDSRERLQTFMDSATDAFTIWDADLNLVDLNKAALSYLPPGTRKEDVRGRNYAEFMPSSLETGQYYDYVDVIKTGVPLFRNQMMPDPQYGKKWLNVRVFKVGEGLGIVTTDITQQKESEAALRESEERYRSIIRVSNTGAWEYHRDTGYQWCSPEYFSMLGYDAADFVMDGRANLDAVWTDLLCPDDKEEASRVFADYLSKGSVGLYENHFRLRHKDGRWVWIWSRGQTLRNADGSLTNLTVGTQIDVTERRVAEEERAKLRDQLAQAQKMESVGRLAGGVAHDFNNMLGVILGHTELALEHVDRTQPLFTDLLEIHHAAERSADLTRQLLAFARRQTVVPKVLDLNDTVEGMLKMLRRLIGENIDLAWLPGKNVGAVNMDPSQIDQILANLCVNARDAIEDTGRMTIETQTASFDAAYCAAHTGALPGEYVLLAVSDNGCGMAPEVLSHVFEPFFTTKETGKGTGLGLATVYGIVKQNNGFISAYSELGQGTTFKIFLPRYRDLSGAEKTVSVRQSPRGTETILLVEDEPTMLRLATVMLESLGYTVVAASDPREAIRLAGARVGEIHLLITDVVMPEMNGRDLAKSLTTERGNLKCLFMSGYTADVIAHHGVLDRDLHFIQKPFSKETLATKVRDALDSG